MEGDRSMQEKRDITIVIADPTHLAAHEPDFILQLEAALELVRRKLTDTEPVFGCLISDGILADSPVGRSGLAELDDQGRTGLFGGHRRSFWGYRRQRSIPSHLIEGKKESTNSLCFAGWWVTSAEFRLHTLYPGTPAPREIHDPEISLDELDEAVRFWSRHAIIVDSGAYTR
jgi:hypothetical protein